MNLQNKICNLLITFETTRDLGLHLSVHAPESSNIEYGSRIYYFGEWFVMRMIFRKEFLQHR